MYHKTYPRIVGTYENTNQQVMTYKTEALYRICEEIWERHARLVTRLHDFQTKHFENRQSIGNLNYESKIWWVNLADKYIIEASSPIQSEMYEFLGARLGAG
jgi:hypothetical protein